MRNLNPFMENVELQLVVHRNGVKNRLKIDCGKGCSFFVAECLNKSGLSRRYEIVGHYKATIPAYGSYNICFKYFVPWPITYFAMRLQLFRPSSFIFSHHHFYFCFFVVVFGGASPLLLFSTAAEKAEELTTTAKEKKKGNAHDMRT